MIEQSTQVVAEAWRFSLRRLIKVLVFALCLLVVSPLIVLSWLEARLSRGERVFVSISQFLALFPSIPGTWLRAAFYYAALERCSWETHVGFGSVFTHRAASIAHGASMGAYCVIGHAEIGRNVMMGSRVSIPSGKRQHFDAAGRLTATARFDRVAIGDGCWIGEGAIIMADVGASAVVSAGAVVTKEVPGACIAGGNPARVLKELADRAGDNQSE